MDQNSQKPTGHDEKILDSGWWSHWSWFKDSTLCMIISFLLDLSLLEVDREVKRDYTK